LPRKDGREVLSFLKTHQDLTLIPVVILTSSRAPDDIIKSYGLHANCYVVKPTGLDQFLDMVKAIESFWLGIVMLPTIVEQLPEA
jgi:DNA-binding response OmpR family regulator